VPPDQDRAAGVERPPGAERANGHATPLARWQERARQELDALAAAQRLRSPRVFDARGPRGHLEGHGEVVAFASNDYLGLANHPAVAKAAAEAAERVGTGAGASRLVTGTRPLHRELEAALAALNGTECAVVFPTGFAANLGVLVAVASLAGVVVSDERNHASIVDGCRLARATVAIARHGDAEHVDWLLARHDGQPAVVVSDLVFSMDGDVAPVEALAASCRRHGALLVLDEAHAVLGPELHLEADGTLHGAEVLRVGTLSKALGALGGFVACRREYAALIVNRARAYIFTTAMSPPDAAAALAALDVLRSPEGAALLTRLRRHVDVLAPGHPSPILPVVLGSDEAALRASAQLLEHGIWVPAIRPPSVPEGTSRLRVSLSAAHRDDEVARLAEALRGLGVAPRASGPASVSLAAVRRPRPRRLVVVVGTGTEVGKTVVAAGLLRAWRTQGLQVGARKPAQSFEPGTTPLDAEALAAASGEHPDVVCPPAQSYPVAMAPPMAAASLGMPPLSVEALIAAIGWPEGLDVGLVETAGGLCSPQADDADGLELIDALGPDAVVLVADAGLGTINAVRLTLRALSGREVHVVLNRFRADSTLHRANLAWLREREGLELVAVPEACDPWGVEPADALFGLAELLAQPCSGQRARQRSGVMTTTRRRPQRVQNRGGS
jgi:8-amino-7-oxononanoate synthase